MSRQLNLNQTTSYYSMRILDFCYRYANTIAFIFLAKICIAGYLFYQYKILQNYNVQSRALLEKHLMPKNARYFISTDSFSSNTAEKQEEMSCLNKILGINDKNNLSSGLYRSPYHELASILHALNTQTLVNFIQEYDSLSSHKVGPEMDELRKEIIFISGTRDKGQDQASRVAISKIGAEEEMDYASFMDMGYKIEANINDAVVLNNGASEVCILC